MHVIKRDWHKILSEYRYLILEHSQLNLVSQMAYMHALAH